MYQKHLKWGLEIIDFIVALIAFCTVCKALPPLHVAHPFSMEQIKFVNLLKQFESCFSFATVSVKEIK